MCGIVGYTSRKPIKVMDEGKLERFFKKALLLDVVRGKDSTGVAKIHESGSVEVIKKAIPSYDFLDMNRYNKFINSSRCAAMIGHNRTATRGLVNDDNAHPFTHGKITLVHNGTLNNHYSLDGNHSTDSETIAYCFDKNGVMDTLEKMQGAYALVWYDEAEKTVNFARNEDRPLYIATIEENIILFASEPWLLVGAISDPFGIPLKLDGPIEPLPVGNWLSVPINGEKLRNRAFTPKKTPEYMPATTHYFSRAGSCKVGNGSMDKLGVEPNTTILFELTSVGNKYSNSTMCTVRGTVVSIVDSLPNISIDCFSVSHDMASGAKEGGIVIWQGIVMGDSNTVKDCIIVTHVRPVCGKPKFLKKKFPKHLDGVYTALLDLGATFSGLNPDEIVNDKFPDYYDSKGHKITKTEFEELIKDGCAVCGHPLAINGDDYEYWDDNIMHTKCLEEWEDSVAGDLN